jgi:Ca2+:H+ antiporter
LLPVVSFAADGTVAVVYFIRYMFRHFFHSPTPPTTLAKGRAIDLSIQFTLFWMPFFVLLGWWTNKPLTLLFDIFEVAILLGSCFLVNYVTADAKTNWAEGVAMVAFYVMIALCAWFYAGQPEIKYLSQCESVAAAIAAVATGNTTGHATH